MSKYISIFFLSVIISVVLFLILGNVFKGGDPTEDSVYIFGTIIVILLSFLISQIFYLINLVGKKK